MVLHQWAVRWVPVLFTMQPVPFLNAQWRKVNVRCVPMLFTMQPLQECAFYNAAFAYPSVFSPLCLFKCVSTGQMCFQMCLFKCVFSNVSSLGSTGQVCPSAFYKPPFFPAFLLSKATPFCSSVILKV